uniref:adenylyltransferase/cytidyltransferase family protein n=1 Tax=Oceanispirochaeta sp. TaxID=2035350 RepID=UPI00260A4B69
PGHEYFLQKAKEYGDRLIVVVARDSFVESFKKKSPLHDELSRLHFIQNHPLVTEACLADEQIGGFSILNRIRPDIICLGHDQQALAESIHEWMKHSDHHYKVKHLKPYNRDKYSSTLLNKIKDQFHHEKK